MTCPKSKLKHTNKPSMSPYKLHVITLVYVHVLKGIRNRFDIKLLGVRFMAIRSDFQVIVL